VVFTSNVGCRAQRVSSSVSSAWRIVVTLSVVSRAKFSALERSGLGQPSFEALFGSCFSLSAIVHRPFIGSLTDTSAFEDFQRLWDIGERGVRSEVSLGTKGRKFFCHCHVNKLIECHTSCFRDFARFGQESAGEV
jgi:hypothetical protein